MKGILIILIVFGAVILAAVAFALVPNLLTPAAPQLEAPPPGDAAATPTLAAGLPPVSAGDSAPPAGTLPAVGSGQAAPGSFNGSFAGTLTSDDGSTAPVTLDLTQTGTTVAGDITIGEGLTIDGGNCGAQAVPAGRRSISGQTDASNANHVEASAGYDVQGFTVTAELIADLSADGNTLNGRIDLALPFLCGRNPAISGTLQRQ